MENLNTFLKKNQKEKKEKQSNVQNKEIRLTPFIGKADLETKSKKSKRIPS